MKKFAFISFLFICSLGLLMAQQRTTIPHIGSKAPSFKAETTEGKLTFPEDFGDSWKILFAHPKDFTPVCSSELLELAHEQGTFSHMDVKLAVLSTDIMNQHLSWKKALEEVEYKGREPVEITFPLISDPGYEVSDLYGMIQTAESVKENVRGVYIIDPDNTIRSVQFYPNEVGRNLEEIKRTIQALQTTYMTENRVTPANWQPGDDLIVPVLSQEERNSVGQPGSEYYQVDWFLNFVRQ